VSAVRKLQHPDFTGVTARLVNGHDTTNGFTDQVLIRFHILLQFKYTVIPCIANLKLRFLKLNRKANMKFLITLLATGMLTFTAWAAGPVNVNSATAEEIAEGLTGIGLSKAELIVKYREANGSFTHVDELVNVKGIGIRTIDKNRGLILLSDSDSSAEK
jgi:competence protein ComEA